MNDLKQYDLTKLELNDEQINEYGMSCKIMRDLLYDFRFRQNSISFEESQKNYELSVKWTPIYNRYNEAFEKYQAEKKVAEDFKRKIDAEKRIILDRYSWLTETYHPKMEITIDEYERQIRQHEALNAKTKHDFFYEVECLDNEIKALRDEIAILNKKQEKLLPINKGKIVQEKFELEIKIKSLESQKDNYIRFQYPGVEASIAEIEHQIKHLQNIIKDIKRNFEGELKVTKAELEKFGLNLEEESA